MGDTNIEWATKVWNPTRGCRRVSPGCEHCYAERQAARHAGPGGPYEGLVAISKHGPRWTGAARLIAGKLREPLTWRRRDGGRERVFVDSMSDLFYEGFTDEEIAEVFGVMAACPWNDFLVLTKRPARARDWFGWARSIVRREVADTSAPSLTVERWPLPNVWLGVSVEDQQRADERIPILLDTPAAVRFVSAEPLLGPVRLPVGVLGATDHLAASFGNPLINWVIVGGESGPGARPMDLAWARSLVEQCQDAGAACFVKQLGARPVGEWGQSDPPTFHLTDLTASPPRQSIELARSKAGVWKLADKKGGNMGAWPEDLRVRQFPTSSRREKQEEGAAGRKTGASAGTYAEAPKV